MTVISKEMFNKFAHNATCHEMLHPKFSNCSAAQFDVLKNSSKGCFKFFLAIYVLELLIQYKKINKPYIKKHIKAFFKTYVYGVMYTNVFFSSICTYRNLVGSYSFNSTVFIPGIIGGLSIFIENSIMKNLNTVMFSALTLETIVLYLTGTNLIKRSIATDTLFFMMCNAVFIYLLKNDPLSKEATILWFFQPKRDGNDRKIETNNCCENKICSKHLLQDGLKYFSAGYTFQIVKHLIKSISTIIKQPSTLISNLFSKRASKTGLFFASYVTIYQIICQVLYQSEGKEKGNHSLIAGFFSGISYCVDPNLQMNVLPLSFILQILWINIRTKYKIPNWYLKEIFFALCSGILLHSAVLAPHYCPKYVTNMLSIVSNGQYGELLKNVHNYILEKRKNTMHLMQ